MIMNCNKKNESAEIPEAIGKYQIEKVLSRNQVTQSFRVIDTAGKRYFLKMFNGEELTDNKMTDIQAEPVEDRYGILRRRTEKVPMETAVVRIEHPRLLNYVDRGVWEPVGKSGSLWPYLVTEWVDGVSLSDYIAAHRPLPQQQVIAIIHAVADALRCLHDLGWAHNDITPDNVMIAGDGNPDSVKLIDMTHTSEFLNRQRQPFFTADLNPFYQAPECYHQIYNASTDVFSLAALLYTIVSGHAPWQKAGEKEIGTGEIRRRQQEESLSFPSGTPYAWKIAMLNALYLQGEKRPSLDGFCETLEGKRLPDLPPLRQGQSKSGTAGEDPSATLSDGDGLPEFTQRIGPGFSALAGMREIRLTLTRDIIYVLSNYEKARNVYHITLPNGLLLWGPKGCGKTYLVSKFAEESGLNFVMVETGDLLTDSEVESSHRLSALFDKAQQQAPSIICFDEIDALTPEREHDDTPILVNGFLSCLNRCGDRGIFVIGTTNRPEKIERAFLRTGRFDKVVYVPTPDCESRRELFDLYLKGRLQSTCDTQALAERTEGYTASDIETIVNQAAILAFYEDRPIGQHHLDEALAEINSSLSDEERDHYESLRRKF